MIVGATNPSRGVLDFNDWRALQPVFDAALHPLRKDTPIEARWLLRLIFLLVHVELLAGPSFRVADDVFVCVQYPAIYVSYYNTNGSIFESLRRIVDACRRVLTIINDSRSYVLLTRSRRGPRRWI